jgi:hypothetical protein
MASSEKIFYYYYPSNGILTNKKILLNFEFSKFGIKMAYSKNYKILVISASITDPIVFIVNKLSNLVEIKTIRRQYSQYKV